MLFSRTLTATAVTALLFGASTVGSAQQQDQDNRSQDRDRYQQSDDDQEGQTRSQNRRDRQRDAQDRKRQRGSQQQSENRSGVSPISWVRVATDYDNDGRFDAVETIYYYDLQKARRSSRDRADRDGRGMKQDNMQAKRGSQRKQETVQGEIVELRKEQFAGMDDRCVIARIESRNGETAKAVLGPHSQIEDLDLSEGDNITVRGVRGRINDKSMLFARMVKAGGDQVSINMPSPRGLKRVRGDIRSTRMAKFRNQDEKHLVAEVELVSGKRETVNLGPKSRVQDLDLQQGDEVSLLVRPGRINGESAMIAEQIQFDDQTVKLPRPNDIKRFRGGDTASNSRDRRTSAYRGESRDNRESEDDTFSQN